MSEVRVPYMDLSWQWRQIEAEAMPQLRQLFAESAYCLGPWVTEFETAFAEYIGVKHAVGVNSGTSALHLALLAVDIGPGDQVLLPTFTFIATAWAPLYTGATPVLCDVEPDTGNIDMADAARRINSNTRAIMPVHLFGQAADLDAAQTLARRHDLTLIEDAAQAHGARSSGRRVGGIGRMGCFSFYPGKNLGAAGEGGVIVTDDDALATRLRSLRSHGERERYVHTEIGYNYRMEGIQGLILSQKLRHLEAWNAHRQHVAQRYHAGLAGLPLILPQAKHDHVYHLYVVRSPARDALREHLTRAGVQTGLHYPVPLHRQPALAHLQMDREGYPVADQLASEVLSLPMYAGMPDAQVDLVIESICTFFA